MTKKKRTLLIIFSTIAFLIISSLYNILVAQEKAVITASNVSLVGSVNNAQSNPIAGATIILFSLPENKVLKTAVTEQNGSYRFENVLIGSLKIIARSTGYQADTVFFEIKNGDTVKVLPLIKLKPETIVLNDIHIVAEKKVIELKNDKIIFNVENSISSVGDNALEALRKAPGVSVGVDESISLKGNGGVQILINGRNTQLSGADLNSYLKSISASNISAIEIIGSPSAQYDASGTAGVINIKIKRNPNNGLNSSISANGLYGKNGKFNGQGDINYRSGKLNVYGNYGYSYDDYETLRTIDRTVFQTSPISYNQSSTENDLRKTRSYKAGIDWLINKENTLGFLFNGFDSDNQNLIVSSTDISGMTGVIDSVLRSENTTDRDRHSKTLNLNYKFADTLGRELSIDLSYIDFRRQENSYQPNVYLSLGGTQLQTNNTYYNTSPSDVKIGVAKIDYTSPLFGGTFSVGSKASFVNSANKFDFYNVYGNIYIPDDERTNSFDYDENIIAGYVNFSKDFKRWSYQVGVRAEQTISKGNLDAKTTVDSRVVDNTYLNFFPSASASYKLDDDHAFSLSYSRRIQRPDYLSLNPFEARLDELTFSRGNPFLKPQMSHSFQLSYSFKQYLIASVNYLKTNDVVALIMDSVDRNKITYIPQNIASGTNIGLSVSSNIKIAKWWSLYTGINTYRANYEGLVNQADLSNSKITFMWNGQNTFKISPTISSEVSFFYRSPEVFGTFVNKSISQISLGLQKKIFGDHGRISVNYSDVFHKMKLSSFSNFKNLAIYSTQTPETRILKIGFYYKFGKSGVKKARERNVGSEEENRRL
ncbi:TonB-dependent receptor domain-containing protein [Pedobacter sp. GR22-10]|uniref:TonB-dependent receptor domain-containing protein n=1 Tax=Pedobacter sp. GR22-10 TaxID=2994472 RepID=UPI002246D11C|nr:TonB-dependent receptor [Pedobacter sp. GR22-10]MCX2431625.1 TonB-dependent receptor [Pedobacter sp. GR22-10]